MNNKGATSIQRLLVMVVMLDLLIGFSLAFALSGSTATMKSDFTNYMEKGQNTTKSIQENYGTQTPDTTTNTGFIDKTFGDVRLIAGAIWDTIKTGLGMKGSNDCYGEDCSVDYIFWITGAVGLVLLIIHILIAVEAYFVFFSKKYT